MRHVQFEKAYDHPTPTGHLAYPAGFSGEVSNETADAAEKAGAVKSEPPTKPAKG